MNDISIQGESFMLPLEFAMVAANAAAELKGVQDGRSLDETGQNSLYALSELLETAAKGGSVLRDRSMAAYSSEAMSAYHLVQDTDLPGATSADPADQVTCLREMAGKLKTFAADQSEIIPVGKYREFLIFLARKSLDESHGSKEEVLRIV